MEETTVVYIVTEKRGDDFIIVDKYVYTSFDKANEKVKSLYDENDVEHGYFIRPILIK